MDPGSVSVLFFFLGGGGGGGGVRVVFGGGKDAEETQGANGSYGAFWNLEWPLTVWGW